MDPYVGQLVVLRTIWNLQSHRIGIVVDQIEDSDRLMVMWTVPEGIKLVVHIKDALIPISSATMERIKERSCVFK